jgi:hypothetical protein
VYEEQAWQITALERQVTEDRLALKEFMDEGGFVWRYVISGATRRRLQRDLHLHEAQLRHARLRDPAKERETERETESARRRAFEEELERVKRER